MRREMITTLGLSALLLACAHGRSEPATMASESRAEARAANTPSRSQDTDDVTPSSPKAGTVARKDDDKADNEGESLNLPARPKSDRMASTGDDLSGISPDNTARNERDRDGANLTPLDQGDSELDLDLTQRIRKTIMDNDSLSFTAKNVKVITRDGHVTLRGVVNTVQERDAIGKAAVSRAGATHVTNQLEVNH